MVDSDYGREVVGVNGYCVEINSQYVPASTTETPMLTRLGFSAHAGSARPFPS